MEKERERGQRESEGEKEKIGLFSMWLIMFQ